MAVGILVNKQTNIIHDIFDNVIDIEPQKINYVGGYVEGFDESKIEVIVTNDITTEIVQILNESEQDEIPVTSFKTKFKDKKDMEVTIGSELPTGLTNIKAQFIKPDPDQRIADLELIIAELMNN